jgi:four helix bundle protein
MTEENKKPNTIPRCQVPFTHSKDLLKQRTKQFALRIIRLAGTLPETQEGRIIKGQLLRCGTSVGANYRSARRARSTADFINKMGIVEEEADETMYWMELIVESGLMKEKSISELYKEADEIVSMVVASINTARNRKK